MEPSCPRVALLIDGDNSASVSIPSLLAEAGKLGDVMIRRVYGNWSLSSMHAALWSRTTASWADNPRQECDGYRPGG